MEINSVFICLRIKWYFIMSELENEPDYIEFEEDLKNEQKVKDSGIKVG